MFFIVTILASLSPHTAYAQRPPIHSNVIYGNDDRKEVYSISSSFWTERARSTAALFTIGNARLGNRFTKLSKERLGRSLNLCRHEPFSGQPSSASCTGFLIKRNLLLTAGHCITSVSDCNEATIIFDYVMKNSNTAQVKIPRAQTYQCKEILMRQEDPNGLDFALLRLDRNVDGRTPLELDTSDYYPVNMALSVIGHPSGLPKKFAGGGKIRKEDINHFVSNLDTFGGNSGSPVFDVSTGKVKGILVSGEDDYEVSGSCWRAKKCSSDACKGETSVKLSQVYLAIRAFLGQ